jgi:hypothetical protein
LIIALSRDGLSRRGQGPGEIGRKLYCSQSLLPNVMDAGIALKNSGDIIILHG